MFDAGGLRHATSTLGKPVSTMHAILAYHVQDETVGLLSAISPNFKAAIDLHLS